MVISPVLGPWNASIVEFGLLNFGILVLVSCVNWLAFAMANWGKRGKIDFNSRRENECGQLQPTAIRGQGATGLYRQEINKEREAEP
jgi:hypothetical protein